MSADSDQPRYPWVPYKEAHLDRVEVGGSRPGLYSRENVHVVDIVPPRRKAVDRAWRRAERWCAKANAALMEATR